MWKDMIVCSYCSMFGTVRIWLYAEGTRQLVYNTKEWLEKWKLPE